MQSEHTEVTFKMLCIVPTKALVTLALSIRCKSNTELCNSVLDLHMLLDYRFGFVV